jgi:SAM-dependent methyltransferase
VRHESELHTWTQYEPYIGSILKSLPANEPILDLGSGNRNVDDPQIIRMDVCRTPFVDLVGDAHALPFRSESLGLVYATAVFEHLKEPWVAAREIWRVLKPGGYVLADCNFVFPFHGFPAVYFNASGEGLRQLFLEFTELEVAVPPWQMPSFAVEAILREYLRFFQPQSEREREFETAALNLLAFPIREFDVRFKAEDALRIAAGVSYLGIKQPAGDETLIPEVLMSTWAKDQELRRRFPRPEALLDFKRGRMDNLFHWARAEGALLPHLARYFEDLVPFRKGRLSDGSA